MVVHLRRFARSHPVVVDAVLAVVIALLIGVGALVRAPAGGTTAEDVGWGLFAVAALPLVVRRRNPYVCLALTLAATLAGYSLASPFPPAILPAAVALYSVGIIAGGRKILYVAGGVLVLATALALLSRDQADLVEALVFSVAWVVGALALGYAVANRRAYVEQIRQRAIQAEKTKEEEAQFRVDEERLRIARDVHDGVAHALASISIQASAGSTVLDTDLEAARQAFNDIRGASRSALAELRSTLGLLRHGVDELAVEGIGREQVGQLAAVLRAEGVTVRVVGNEADWHLDGETGVAAYRILQESLTNVLRHSGARNVEVAVERREHEIVLTVVDDGRGVTSAPGDARGYGLIGMRERASLVGGSCECGPGPEGGFRVKAVLPIKEAR
jgi:signal transduction histidine kinase